MENMSDLHNRAPIDLPDEVAIMASAVFGEGGGDDFETIKNKISRLTQKDCLQLAGEFEQSSEMESANAKEAAERRIHISACLLGLTQYFCASAMHDQMTGLFNKAALYQRITVKAHELLSTPDHPANERRHQAGSSLVIIDLDKFKEINDTYGHGAGDEAIKLAAETVRETIRAADMPARVGGDEFAALIEDASFLETQEIVERLQDAFETLSIDIQHEGETVNVPVRASIGFANLEKGMGAKDLDNAADQAMYRTKTARRAQRQPAFFAPAPLAV